MRTRSKEEERRSVKKWPQSGVTVVSVAVEILWFSQISKLLIKWGLPSFC